MKCPNCNETLVMANRQNIEIDYCPSCRGVWLDRGELDKIIERSAGYAPSQDSDFNREHRSDTYRTQPPYNAQQPHYNDPHYKPKKKKGFLSDFFDFD